MDNMIFILFVIPKFDKYPLSPKRARQWARGRHNTSPYGDQSLQGECVIKFVEYLEFLKARKNMLENVQRKMLSFIFYQCFRKAARKIVFLTFLKW